MGDGTQENPYTREDVLRLIEENGGTARGLDLTGREFQEGIDLTSLDLSGVIFRQKSHTDRSGMAIIHSGGVNLTNAHFENTNLHEADFGGAVLTNAHFDGASLYDAHLDSAWLNFASFSGTELTGAHFEGAMLLGADLEGADLRSAHLEGADFSWAKLEGVRLRDATFSSKTNLESAKWGDFIIGDEKHKNFGWTTDIYRKLRIWYSNAGIHDTAARFFYREQESTRKLIQYNMVIRIKQTRWRTVLSSLIAVAVPVPRLLWLWLLKLLCGYGEKPERVAASALVIIFGLAIAYYLWGSFNTSSFWDTLYYSVVSFTAVGYGNWAPQPTGWAKGVGAAEAFLGVFMMALFLVTFTRKMTR